MCLSISAAGWYLISASLLFLVIFLGFIVFFYAVRGKQNKLIAEQNQMKATYEQELLRSQLEIQEQTFKIISQEIHDNIGQMLSLAKLNLNTLDMEQKEKALVRVTDAKELVGKAIQDLRDLSKTLNTDAIASVGLIKALGYELHMMQKAGFIETKLETTGPIMKLEPQKELILFRIVQEALHNIVKHSGASLVQVVAAYTNDNFYLTVDDNGTGFNQDTIVLGTGLRNMQSRAKLIGAGFAIKTKSSNGTQIEISIPTTN